MNGNAIELSGFNANQNHAIHELQQNLLAREFLNGNISSFNFNGVDESINSNFTEMLQARAQELGSENHSISSQCSDGFCSVSIEQNQEQNQIQQQEFSQEEQQQAQNIA